jgi:NAD(P)-dependent dehydrogenase (short-subunit alcohol dehydrogenase family)
VLAEELRGDGIRVGAISPGAVDTPLWDAIPGGPDRARMLTAETVARAVLLMVTLPAGATLEDLTLLPAGGIL